MAVSIKVYGCLPLDEPRPNCGLQLSYTHSPPISEIMPIVSAQTLTVATAYALWTFGPVERGRVSMPRNVLPLGRLRVVVEDARRHLGLPDVRLFVATGE